jgi:uncharacterized membrane protein YgdD (TMEM256/DUF423 family)
MRSTFIVTGALLAALGVGLGAFAAHGLSHLVEQGRFSPKDLETFRTAVLYQMIHAMGLILIGLMSHVRPSALLTASGWTMFFGIVVFSGFLYAYVGTGMKLLAMPVPIGGVAFILAWLGVAAAGIRG